MFLLLGAWLVARSPNQPHTTSKHFYYHPPNPSSASIAQRINEAMQANRGSAHGPRPRSRPTESAAKGGALPPVQHAIQISTSTVSSDISSSLSPPFAGLEPQRDSISLTCIVTISSHALDRGVLNHQLDSVT